MRSGESFHSPLCIRAFSTISCSWANLVGRGGGEKYASERELHTEIGAYFEAVGPNFRPAENLEDFGKCLTFCYAVVSAVSTCGSVTAFCCSQTPCLFFGHEGRGRSDSPAPLGCDRKDQRHVWWQIFEDLWLMR